MVRPRSSTTCHPGPLHAAGMKRTAPRQALLQVLEASDRPLTVEEIRTRMGDGASGIPTIYRNLQRFVQEGWAEALPGPDQILRYVRCLSTEHHHHVLCERCGRVTEVEGCGLESVVARLERESGFRILRHDLTFHGLCPDCQPM